MDLHAILLMARGRPWAQGYYRVQVKVYDTHASDLPPQFAATLWGNLMPDFMDMPIEVRCTPTASSKCACTP